MLSLLLFLMAPFALLTTPIDIFPAISVPVVSIVWTYTGLVPTEMETRIASIYERALTTTVSNIEHIESQSINGVAVVKVFLQPQANVDDAIAEVLAEAQSTVKQLPPGINPPLIIRYNASTVPILEIGLSGKGMSEQQLNDLGNNFIRPQLATVQGAIPIPYGGKVRQIMVDIDSQKLQAQGLSATDVVNAVNKGVPHYLFVPFAEAVVFALLASYFFLAHHHPDDGCVPAPQRSRTEARSQQVHTAGLVPAIARAL